MNPVRAKKVCAVLVIAGILAVCAGFCLYMTGGAVPGIILMIAGIAVAMLCKGVLAFFSMLGFEREVAHPKKRSRNGSLRKKY